MGLLPLKPGMELGRAEMEPLVWRDPAPATLSSSVSFSLFTPSKSGLKTESLMEDVLLLPAVPLL